MQEAIWIAGHNGMVGSAIVRALERQGRHVITIEKRRLDLRNQQDVEGWLLETKPTSIILAAAKVGGILANQTYPAEFLYDNLCLQTNVIHAAHKTGVDKLVFLGSSCIYPKFAEQPIREDSLLTGPLEPTNEWYAIAKIAGIKLCQAYMKQYGRQYVSVMPCNVFGPNDNFDLTTSHVLPALIHKFHNAIRQRRSVVEVWGTGSPLREFIYVDDLAAAIIHCHDHYTAYEHINCGSSEEVSIDELARLVSEVMEFSGTISFDTTKPDGTPRKIMDSSRLRGLGWRPEVSLREGIKRTVDWFQGNVEAEG